MADKEVKITFAEEKMEALVFFLGEQNEKVEDVLTAHLDKTYEKYVPQQVRKFVESRMPVAEEENVQEVRGQRQTRGQGRRGNGQARRQHSGNGIAGSNETQELAEGQTENAVVETEETQNMTMGM